MHQNIQGLSNKVQHLDKICRDSEVDIACLTEIWLKEEQMDIFVPTGYKVASAFCRTNAIHGGVAILVKDGCDIKVLDRINSFRINKKFFIEKTA